MDETSTKNLFAVTNHYIVKEKGHTENLGADDMMFFHALRTDLNQLQVQPRLQTIHRILDYSKSIK